MNEFKAELMGEWLAPSEGYQRAVKRLAEAEVASENFDRQLPHVPGRFDDNVEVRPDCRAASSSRAKAEAKLAARGLWDVSRQDCEAAGRRVGRLSAKRCAELCGVELRPVRDARMEVDEC